MKTTPKPKLPRTLEEPWAIEDEFPLAFVPDSVHFSLKRSAPVLERSIARIGDGLAKAKRVQVQRSRWARGRAHSGNC